MFSETELKKEELDVVVGGLVSGDTYNKDDERWNHWLEEQNIIFKNKQLENEIKKLYIKGSFDLANNLLGKAIDAGAAVITGGASEAGKAAGKIAGKVAGK